MPFGPASLRTRLTTEFPVMSLMRLRRLEPITIWVI